MADYIANETALKLSHIKLIKRLVWTIGAWPAELFGEKMHYVFRVQKVFIPISTIFVFIGEVYYLWLYSNQLSLVDKGSLYIAVLLTVLTHVRGIMLNFKDFPPTIKYFMTQFHLTTKNCENEFKAQVTTWLEKISLYFTYYSVTMMFIGMLAFNLLPAYISHQRGAFSRDRPTNVTMEYALYWSFPNFSCLDHFYFALFINFLLSYNTTVSVCGFDMMVALMAFQIIGQITILNNKIENLPKPAGADSKRNIHHTNTRLIMYDRKENEKIKQLLLDLIRHHLYIVRFCEDVSTIFGPMLGVNYLFHLFSGCLLLLICTQSDINSLLTYVPLGFIILTQLVQASVVFELIHTKSQLLIDAVYGMPWECMSGGNQFMVMVFLRRVQQPVQLTAMGVVTVGVTTMQAILKTSFSYYAILRSLNE